MKATLAVVVPTYNGERYLATALSSIVGQPNVAEVLVVDDGSSDRTVEVAKTFWPRLPLKLLQPERRGNWMAMTNIGLAAATSEWSTILHQDDSWLPNRNRQLEQYLDTDAGLVIMGARFVNERGTSLGAWPVPRGVRRAQAAATMIDVAASLYVQNWVAVPSATFRTEMARACGALDEELWYTADWDLWLKLAQVAPVKVVARAGSRFRVHGESQTVRRSHDLDAFREQMETVQRRHAWVTQQDRDPQRLHRAGALSTETNVILAGLLHRRHGPATKWLRTARSAGVAGTTTFLQNAVLGHRVMARILVSLPTTAPLSAR